MGQEVNSSATDLDQSAVEALNRSALEYHRFPRPGKIAVLPIKGMTNQRDLALAYSPGVAAPCMAIHADPSAAALYTSRSNLVAVVSNGTAVLGLGNIGPLASKPVMEGKGCLFQKFAGIDVFDIELNETDTDKLVDIIASLEPTFGGINLEDIKAPECFEIERRLRERLKIPVFHDDQHGTAIVAAAAILNGLEVVGKRIEDVKLVCSGAGAAAIACLDLLVGLGVRRENVWVTDSKGVIYVGRGQGMDPQKERYAQATEARTLADVMPEADVFLGVSMAGVLKPEMVKVMADRPLILALANPEPEIRPEAAKAARPDSIIATGRSDYPNQVNNVLCFPFIFRGALDVGATTINEEMKLAATRAIAALAKEDVSDVVAAAYGRRDIRFGAEYLIPAPFDPRLITAVAPAVAEAAMKSGIATRPLDDLKGYRDRLQGFVYRSGTIMQPVFAAAAKVRKRVAYAEGEDERVLRAVQVAVEEGLAEPLLIGRPDTIRTKIRELGLRLSEGREYQVVNVDDEARLAELAEDYYQLRRRQGLTRDTALAEMRRNNTLIGAMLLRLHATDGLLCGTSGVYETHLKHIVDVVGRKPGIDTLAAMNVVMLPNQTVFITDTYINENPTAEQIAEIALLAADEVRRFGVTPRVALLSHSSFGSAQTASAVKMREALGLIQDRAPDLEVEGEMHGDAALNKGILDRVFPDSRLSEAANLLVMPNLDAANITFNVLKAVAGQGVTVGPILLGAKRPVHILTPTSTVRRITNMTALTSVEADIAQ
ncbi:NADP-dependent malic enzyme [Microvirga zambiensis]|uniref:NADP-dependent malic enzyme n=1 Tax=Microvirga zambiensis TaxID=1402137 RepID=UPI00191F7AFD|nr:NADP-dependent malic enzyme [Microvirga zambiensis]